MVAARLVAATLALGLFVLAAPGSPVEPAAANCWQIDGVDDCFSPCLEAASVYNTARETGGVEDKTPSMECPM